MSSNVSHLEFGAGTAVQTGIFFSKLFGWSFHSMGGGPEGWFDTPTCKAGLHANEEPGFGRFCSCKDPEGVRFGLHQAAKS